MRVFGGLIPNLPTLAVTSGSAETRLGDRAGRYQRTYWPLALSPVFLVMIFSSEDGVGHFRSLLPHFEKEAQ